MTPKDSQTSDTPSGSDTMTLRESISAREEEYVRDQSDDAFNTLITEVARLTLDAVEARAGYADHSPDPVQEIVNELRAQLTGSLVSVCQVCDREREHCTCRSYTAGITERQYLENLEEAAGAGLHEERRQRAAGDPVVPASTCKHGVTKNPKWICVDCLHPPADPHP